MEFIFNIEHEKSFFNNNIDSNKRLFPVTISMYISVNFMVDTYRPQLSTSVQSCLEALLVCVYKNGQQTNQYGIGWFGLSVFKEGQREMGLLATTIFSATHAVLECWNNVVTIRNNVAAMLPRWHAAMRQKSSLRIVSCNITLNGTFDLSL